MRSRTPLRDRAATVVGLYRILRSWGHGRAVSLVGAFELERTAELRYREEAAR